MDEPGIPTPTHIAERAQGLKLITLGLQLALPAFLSPQVPMADLLFSFQGPDQADSTPTRVDLPLDLVSDDGQWTQRLSIREIFEKLSTLRGVFMANDMMNFGMMMSVTRIGDMVKTAGLDDQKNPTLEFLRHLRNAAAHGDRWHFLGQEPRHPAHFDAITLTSEMHGQKAFWMTISPFTFVRLMDSITQIFAPRSGVVVTPLGSLDRAERPDAVDDNDWGQ